MTFSARDRPPSLRWETFRSPETPPVAGETVTPLRVEEMRTTWPSYCLASSAVTEILAVPQSICTVPSRTMPMALPRPELPTASRAPATLPSSVRSRVIWSPGENLEMLLMAVGRTVSLTPPSTVISEGSLALG